MADTAARDQANWNQFRGFSPGGRALSNFFDTLGLAANSATLGVGGGVADWLQGQSWGTSAHDARVRLNNSTNFNAGTAAEVLGGVAGAKGVVTGGKAAIGLGRSLLAAAPAVGVRAAALGAVPVASRLPVGQIAKFLVPGAAALGIAGMASGGGDAAPAQAAPVADASSTVTTGPARPMQPTDYITPRDRLSQFLDGVLSGPVSINQARAIGGLVEGTPKPQTFKNQVLGQTAQLSQQIFQSQLEHAQEQLASGTITEAQAKAAVEKATEMRFQRDAGLAGLNPTQLAQAQLMSPDEE